MLLEGTWWMVISVATEARVPVVGTTESVSESTVIARIERDGDGYRLTPDTCGSVFRGGPSIAQTIVPERFIRALPDESYRVLWTEQSGKFRFQAEAGVQDVGWTGEGAWPLGKKDARVVDSDGDGHPGATIQVKIRGFGTEEIYIAQRGQTNFDGWSVSNDEIRGSIAVVQMHQATVGASHPFLKSSPEAKVKLEKSGFTMKRVGDGTRCADVLG